MASIDSQLIIFAFPTVTASEKHKNYNNVNVVSFLESLKRTIHDLLSLLSNHENCQLSPLVPRQSVNLFVMIKIQKRIKLD